jgi:hypothetical protein
VILFGLLMKSCYVLCTDKHSNLLRVIYAMNCAALILTGWLFLEFIPRLYYIVICAAHFTPHLLFAGVQYAVTILLRCSHGCSALRMIALHGLRRSLTHSVIYTSCAALRSGAAITACSIWVMLTVCRRDMGVRFTIRYSAAEPRRNGHGHVRIS